MDERKRTAGEGGASHLTAQGRAELDDNRDPGQPDGWRAVLEAVLAGVATELNTPIGAFCSCHDNLQRATGRLEEALERSYPDYLGDRRIVAALDVLVEQQRVLEVACERLARIMRRLRQIAQRDEGCLALVDLHEAIDDALLLLHHRLAGIDVRRRYGDVEPVRCDPGAVEVVLLHTLLVALAEQRETGAIEISTEPVSATDGLRIVIRAAGPTRGRDADHAAQRPAAAARASGSGLWQSEQIIGRHGGQFALQRHPSWVATIELPAEPRTAAARATDDASVNPEHPSRADEVVSFWFGDEDVGESYPAARAARWFRKDDAFDAEVRERFEDDVVRAGSGALNHWAATPRGRLALILLLDQFSRNVFRGSGLAFANDDLAQALCLEGIETGHDLALRPIERAFFYMPLMHSERQQHQQESVRQFARLAGDAPPELAPRVQSFHDYAVRHAAIIERFGRFPHRNAALDRRSTAAEKQFLQQPGSSF